MVYICTSGLLTHRKQITVNKNFKLGQRRGNDKSTSKRYCLSVNVADDSAILLKDSDTAFVHPLKLAELERYFRLAGVVYKVVDVPPLPPIKPLPRPIEMFSQYTPSFNAYMNYGIGQDSGYFFSGIT